MNSHEFPYKQRKRDGGQLPVRRAESRGHSWSESWNGAWAELGHTWRETWWNQSNHAKSACKGWGLMPDGVVSILTWLFFKSCTGSALVCFANLVGDDEEDKRLCFEGNVGPAAHWVGSVFRGSKAYCGNLGLWKVMGCVCRWDAKWGH